MGRFLLERAFTFGKTRDTPNEDSYQHSERRGIYALSDGASISYDSASWSRILVRRFARRPEIDREWLATAIAEFSALHDRDSLPWMKQAAYDRGSFASLLGVRILDGGNDIRLFAIGDTIAALCDGDEIVSTFPYSEPSEFDRSPQLLSTKPSENAFLGDAGIADSYSIGWTLEGCARPLLLCMTDALGQWFVAQRNESASPVAILRSIRTAKNFRRFVREQRAARRMRLDDTTLLVLA